MVHRTRSPQPGCVRVTFELPDSLWASEVYLAGDFAPGHRHKTPMQQERDGAWRTILLMWRLRFAYWRGAPPAELHRRYYGPPR